ncbi:response regulator transcription factor [Rhodocytophaga aerolata]|uniref:Response regulator transcription factor n=1 Tax=Rhodocytophaga aerolata TaxID=455078 RepID=A0ABT8RBY1_9BACT|nr:response regulator transcription factor [Rhodocytophaga aerolata]MDO1449615.1 response regulator transcription factor [Rhodocytophaga aerolata]
MKILIVEDEQPLLKSITSYFSEENYVCEGVATFNEAIEKVHLYDYDCILLDITLPDGNGLKILEALKAQKKAQGVIIISAKNSLDDKINGLDLGADDYLTKPFHLSELNARVKAVIRRKKFDTNDVIELGNIQINLLQRVAFANQTPLNLTRKELDILLHLIANKNYVVSKSSLAEQLWGDHIDQVDSFDFLFTHIKNLKRKLSGASARVEIKTVYGIGYQLLET